MPGDEKRIEATIDLAPAASGGLSPTGPPPPTAPATDATIDLAPGSGLQDPATAGVPVLSPTVAPGAGPSSAGLLETVPPTPVPGMATPTPSRGSRGPAAAPRVAGYEILRELGRGGMGVVYKARQVKLNRVVALKMVLAGAHAGADQLARFHTEAEAVAHLQHPHIVQIYEVGEHEGLPFFSLEYVDGQSLAERISGQPQPVELAARMCQRLARAMAYAHQHGIIHRDLKPANVLLTAEGEPKITDFGLAKRLESDASQTRSGTLMGTPNYMAPEQARGDVREVGPLADLYALGVILYEMLTGRTPFLGASILDTLHLVRTQEPVPPSRLQPKVPRDLETICLKCLEKEPAKRYASASALADDLDRFLAGEPIQARPVSAPERLWRWCRRNKRVAILSAAVLLLLVSLAAGSTAFSVVVSRQAEQLRHQKAVAETARDQARDSERKARDAQQQAEHAAELARKAHSQAELARQRAEKQRELAIGALDTLVTKVQNQLGDTARTFRLKRELLETAFEGLNQVVANSDPGSGDADQTRAEAHLRMGRLFVQLGHPDSARREYLAAHRIFQQLAASDAANASAQAAVSRSAMALGGICMLLGDLAAAHDHTREALAVRTALARRNPRSEVAVRNLAQAHRQMGEVLRDLGRIDDAAGELTQAHQLQERLLGRSSDANRARYQEDLRITSDRLGELYLLWKDDPARARGFFQQACDLARALVPADDRGTRGRQNLAYALSRLGLCAQRQRDPAAADHFAQALTLWEQLAAEEDPEMLHIQGELALTLARAGRHVEAAAKARQLMQLSPEYPRNLYNVACCYSLCAEAVAPSSPSDDPSAQTLHQQYVEQAMKVLHEAKKRGLENLSFLKVDPDLAAVREHPGFAELLAPLVPAPAP
jgi:serine/threonine-protein kinase